MSARQEVADLLRAGLPSAVTSDRGAGWDVLAFERELVDLRRPTVMVGLHALGPGPVAGVWACTIRVLICAPQESFEAAALTLEEGVVLVLNILDDLPHITLEATAVVVEPKTHAFSVNLTVPLQKGD